MRLNSKLQKIPNLKDLTKTYLILSSEVTISDQDLIQYAQWSRFDPRLGEILVQYLQKKWMLHNPISLRVENLNSKFPQVLPVLLEHAKQINLDNQNIYQHFQAIIEAGISPAPYQSFTIGVYHLGGKLLKKKALRPHPFFKKWGFYETDTFFNKDGGRKIGTQMDPVTRKNTLRQLLNEKKTITVNDYLEACLYAVDRRQAERDLNSFFKLKKMGNTRGRKYIKT